MTQDIATSMETLSVRQTNIGGGKMECLRNHAESASFTKPNSRCIREPYVKIQMLKPNTSKDALVTKEFQTRKPEQALLYFFCIIFSDSR